MLKTKTRRIWPGHHRRLHVLPLCCVDIGIGKVITIAKDERDRSDMAIAFSDGGAAQRSTLHSHVSQVVDSDLIDLGSGAHGRLVEVGDSTWLLLQDRVLFENLAQIIHRRFDGIDVIGINTSLLRA